VSSLESTSHKEDYTTMKHLPHINCSVIAHKNQRYETSGDYWRVSPTVWVLHVSRMSDWRFEALVLIHEIVEMVLTTQYNIKWKDIDRFDMDNPQLDDPGDSKKAPYHWEHKWATRVERLCAWLLDVKWSEYQRDFDKLEYK
jgi:hypothetical protein